MSEPPLISVRDAIAIIDATPVASRIFSKRLEEAQGLCLAQDVLADRDYPPFNKSLMDGYAVRCADVQSTPVELALIGEIAAGQTAPRPLQPGETYAIMTGAPIPPGADGVVPVEETSPGTQTGRVRIGRAESPERIIARRGADCPAGAIVLRRGMKLGAAQLAVAASVGAHSVQVFDRPRVAVLSTGDEIVSLDAIPGPTQIRNSNNIMLVALLRRLGCDVTDLGSAIDKPDLIRAAIERSAGFDALLVTGGMSMGQYDFVPKLLLELGVDLKITKLRIKPGKPFVFGVSGQPAAGSGQSMELTAHCPLPTARYVFGLPGNPVSSFVCTLRLAARLLLRFGGAEQLERWTTAELASSLDANGSREFYQPAWFDGRVVEPLKWKGSADIYTLARANALIVRPENAPPLPAGERAALLEIPQ